MGSPCTSSADTRRCVAAAAPASVLRGTGLAARLPGCLAAWLPLPLLSLLPVLLVRLVLLWPRRWAPALAPSPAVRALTPSHGCGGVLPSGCKRFSRCAFRRARSEGLGRNLAGVLGTGRWGGGRLHVRAVSWRWPRVEGHLGPSNHRRRHLHRIVAAAAPPPQQHTILTPQHVSRAASCVSATAVGGGGWRMTAAWLQLSNLLLCSNHKTFLSIVSAHARRSFSRQAAAAQHTLSGQWSRLEKIGAGGAGGNRCSSLQLTL